MEENRVITINEKSFKDKALEVLNDMGTKDEPTLYLAMMLAIIGLQHKLFYPEKESEKKEQE